VVWNGGGKMIGRIISFAALGCMAILIAATALPPMAAAQAASQPTAQPQAQVPQPQEGGVNWKGVGIGAGTVASNILYVPAKLAYGILGGIAGGASYALTGGNKQVADTIWRSSLGGDYVLTPDMLKGDKPIYFSGPNNTAAPQTSIKPIKPLNDSTASAANPAPPYTSAPINGYSSPGYGGPNQNSGGSHPLDSGAGPTNGSRNTAPLPSTSIE
jgi:hypothetical protein